MEPQLVRFVLPPPEEPARRALLDVVDALRRARPEPAVETVERLDLPTLGRMAEGPALVVAERPLALPRGAVGLALHAAWSIDPAWAGSPAHLHAVAHPALVEAVVRLGVPPERVVATGMPLLPPAAPPLSPGEAAGRLGLATGGTVLAVLLEGLDTAWVDPLLFQLSLLAPPPTLVFFTGQDTLLATLLRRNVPVLGLDARLLGEARQLSTLFAVAELALTTSEAVPCAAVLAAGLPALLLPTRRPSAAAEVRFLAELGLARPMAELRTLAAEADLLRQDEPARQQLRVRAAAALPAEPLAAFLALLQRGLAEREALLQPPRVELVAAVASPGAGPAAPAAAAAPVLEDLNPPAGDPGTEPTPTPRSATAGRGGAASGRSSATALRTTEQQARARFEEVSAELARWRRRAGLAAEAGEAQLQELAAQAVQRSETELARLSAALEQLALQRQAAQRGPATAGTASAEERFRRLELDAELRALKRRMEEM